MAWDDFMDNFDFVCYARALHVNEASRINALSRTLDQRLIVSAAFAQTLPASDRGGLVSLGRYALRGVARPAELFTLDPDAS